MTQNVTPVAQVGNDEKSFGRTRILLDPAQVEEMEKKRRLNLQHKLEIEAQIAEKKRLQNLEDEVQALSNLKIENEANQMIKHNQRNQEQKTKQPQLHNIEKIMDKNNAANNNRRPTMASILKTDQDVKEPERPAPGTSKETRANDVYIKMQEAELAAAEEKHRRLLKRLQHGGHDTRNLENKFAEYKAKVLAKTNPDSNTGPASYETNRATPMSDHEAKLEKQKQILERNLEKQSNSSNNDDFKFDSAISEQKMRQIFKMLREDSNGVLPAELDNESLKLLIKNVAQQEQAKSNESKRPKSPPKAGNKRSKSLVNEKKPTKQEEAEANRQAKNQNGPKPLWNGPKPKGTKMTNSMKDPYYLERKERQEERLKQQIEKQKKQVDKSNKTYNEYLNKQNELKIFLPSLHYY